MMAGPRSWLLPGLVGANLLVILGIALVLALRGDPAAPALVNEPPSVAWEQRFAPEADALPDCPGCNLLLISLDIFRPDHLPCLGYEQPTAPFLCSMVEHGTLFERFIVHAYQTPVSQMAIFTGRYPSSSGFVSFGSRLPPAVATLPEALKAGGYRTVAMGSSFEVMTDMATSAGGGRRKFEREGLNPGLSFGRGFDRFVFTGNRNLPTDAIPWLRQQDDEPFFLWLILGSLHWPYGSHGDPSLADMFDPPGYDGPLRGLPKLGFEQLSRMHDGVMYDDQGATVTTIGPRDTAYINARYDFGLWTVDRFLEDLVGSMPPEQLQRTLIVLHGVHGEDLGEHGYFGHYDVFDTEVSSVLIVLNPRQRAEGIRVQGQVQGVDLAPTLLDVLGLDPLADPDGTSFYEALETGRLERPREAFVERIPLWEDIFRLRRGMPQGYARMIEGVMDAQIIGDTGLRTERWKLLHRRARALELQVSWWTFLSGQIVDRPEWELYDLQADPLELHDLHAERPEVIEELAPRLLDWERRMDARQCEAIEGGWGDPRLRCGPEGEG
jgi:arylsulfatase